MRKLLSVIACLVMGVTMVMAQSKVVKGQVISAEDGEPVIGATVMVTGTQVGITSDMDGNFELSVPAGSKTLTVSYVGMVAQVVPFDKAKKIILESDQQMLDDVVVLGYGTAAKQTFAGSAATVKADAIEKIQATNAVNALAGKVSGVQMNTASGQPGQTTPTIRVRGISSINAGNAPLYIVDGAPYDGDINNIAASDIETMTVLKDASTTSLYGARGANGVIVITTKKGSMKGGGATVNVDAKWGVNTRAAKDYNLVNNPAQYYEMYYASLYNKATLEDGLTPEAAHVWANDNLITGDYGLKYQIYSIPQGQYMIGSNGKMNPNATMGNVVNYKGQDYLLQADDWMDEVYDQGTRQEYNVSISNANEKGAYYSSVSYLNTEGITANSDYERLSARLKADTQAKSWLKVGASASYTHYEAKALGEDGSSNSSGNAFAYATQIAPIYPVYIRDGKGNILVDGNGIKRYDYGDKANAGLDRPYFTSGNALSDIQLDTNEYEGNAFTGNAYAEVDFLKYFTFKTSNSVNLDETRTSNVINPFYGAYASSNGILSKYHTRSWSYTFQQMLTYRQTFADVHHVSLLTGHESYMNRYYYLYGNKSNMFDPTNSELAGAVTDGGINSYTSKYNTEGYFARLDYDYDGKYILGGSFRRDASSRFHPDNRWGNFWSASAAWVINKEDFLDVDWIDILKLKASYGEQGNDAIGNYLYTNTYNIENSGGNVAATPVQKGNKNITWETNANFNAGFDFELLRGRVSGTVEYFYRKTSDMLFSFPLPPSFGFTSYYANVGDMVNNGIEAELTLGLVQTKDFNWDLSLNITSYKNKIDYLPTERKTMTVDGVDGYSSGSYYYGEGESLYTFYTKRYAGVDPVTGKAQYWGTFTENVLDAEGNPVLDENGKNVTKQVEKATTNYSEADYHLCGTSLPDAYGGFSTSLSYKGFDLSLDFTYQIGGQVYDGDYASYMATPSASQKGSAFHADLLKAWTPENPSSTIPRNTFGDSYTVSSSDRFLTDASYISLNNVNFGYTLPQTLTRKAQIERVRFYVSADNVYYWSKRQGLDPRQSITGGASAAYYSPIRSISGGISVTF